MKIIGLGDMTIGELVREVEAGGKFVVFQYAVSLLVVSFKNPTDVHFVRAGEGTFGKAIGPTLISLLVGWWGIPFGIIFTIESLFVNLSGGRNVTDDVMRAILADAGSDAPRKPWER
ncbi:MAG: hypothetical protein K2V38_26190 [Gemmataceae bacterium]|nr:hypothetical protein [Gemmataceae bacterium]